MSKMTDEQFKQFRIKLLEDVFAINRDRKVDVELNSEKNFECGICPIKDTCTATTEEITPEYKKDWCLLERNKYFSRTGNTIEPVINRNEQENNTSEKESEKQKVRTYVKKSNNIH